LFRESYIIRVINSNRGGAKVSEEGFRLLGRDLGYFGFAFSL